MTIICVKDGVVAADGSVWQCDGRILVSKTSRKLCRALDGAIAGAAGAAMNTQRFHEWFAGSTAETRSSPPAFDKDAGFSAVWLDRGGEMWRLDWSGMVYRLEGQDVSAIGAAEEMALGAMYAGASAEQAVRICVERHDCAAGEVFVERLAPVEEPSVESQPAGEAVAWDQTERDARAAAQKANEEWRERMGLA